MSEDIKIQRVVAEINTVFGPFYFNGKLAEAIERLSKDPQRKHTIDDMIASLTELAKEVEQCGGGFTSASVKPSLVKP